MKNKEEKSLEKYYFERNYKLNRWNKILIIALIVLVVINVYLVFGVVNRNRVIDNYFQSVIFLSKKYIASAYSNMQIVEQTDNIDTKIRFLIKTEEDLDVVKSCIGLYSIYHNFKSINDCHYTGNGCADDFFEAYMHVVKEWAIAFQQNDKENIPSEKEIRDYVSDLRALINEFSVYENAASKSIIPIRDLNHEQLNNLFIKLAQKTKNEKVKNELELLLD
ncbi:hypothetical protein [Caloranaerobacter azorensis]|uniref:Uncharacterized protein n=1 Tax=Caloranaerobacter azorensis TaxID=116090 RepID=A0A6P1YCV6_9FIRM|nr:hypothetical protein [Caloranaerobacter azorensis]QIB26907.1 hypothetical protein G3A45_06130 [Caloranaerobacter azorensis]